MPSLLKKSKSNEKSINQELSITIYKKVTKENHKHGSPKRNGDGTLKKCIDLFKQGADPNVLSTLEKSLSEQIELEKLPEKKEEYQKHYKYYIENFLPALKAEVIGSEELAKPPVLNNERKQSQRPQTKRETIVGIILEITNKNNNKDHSSSTIQDQNDRENNQTDRQGNATEPFNKQSFSGKVAVAKSLGSSDWERDSLAKGVIEKGTPGTYKILRSSIYNSTLKVPTLGQVRTLEASKETSLNPIAQSQLNGSFSQSDLSIDCKDLKNEKPSTTADAVEVPSGAKTSKLSSGNDSDSGIDSPRTSKESLKSPVSRRRSSLTLVTSTSSEESVNSIPSVAEENNNLQKENENQMQPEQAAPEEPQVQESGNSDGQANPDQVKEELSQVSLQQVTEARGEESKIPVSRTGMTDDDHTKDPVKSEEKKDKKNTITTVQKLPVNEKKGEDIPLKQPNNRNLHVALVAGCALSTIGCIVAGAMTSGLVGAGLLAMAAVFAIAAVAELHSNFLSSKLTSINVEPLVDDKELTACSRL